MSWALRRMAGDDLLPYNDGEERDSGGGRHSGLKGVVVVAVATVLLQG